MGRNKPTHHVQRLKKLAKRVQNSGKSHTGLKNNSNLKLKVKSVGVKKSSGKTTAKKKFISVEKRMKSKVKEWRDGIEGNDKNEENSEDEDGEDDSDDDNMTDIKSGNKSKSKESQGLNQLLASLNTASTGQSLSNNNKTFTQNMIDNHMETNSNLKSFESGKFDNSNREAENTRRAFYRELRKVINASDVILQVLDARDPDSCRDRALEREVQSTRGKKMVLILNKIDLIPKHAVEAWEKRLSSEFATLPFKCSLGSQGAKRINKGNDKNITSHKDASEGQLNSSSSVIGGDMLLQLLKNYARTGLNNNSSSNKQKAKKAITVGVIGYPNCGKSSLINSLKKSAVVKVGNTAGVTKQMQEIVLDSKVRLLDSPGVVFSGKSEDAGIVLRNAVKVEHLKDPVRVVEDLCRKIPLRMLARHFFDLGEQEDNGGGNNNRENELIKDNNMNDDMMTDTNESNSNCPFPTVRDFLVRIAQTRGQLKRGGAADLSRAAVLVLTEVAQGKFKYHVMPPKVENIALGEGEGELMGPRIVVANTVGNHVDLPALGSNSNSSSSNSNTMGGGGIQMFGMGGSGGDRI